MQLASLRSISFGHYGPEAAVKTGSMLLRDHGDRTFAAVLAKLRCQQCRKAPTPVYLCAGHREFTMGAPADWSIELAPGS